MFAVAGHPAGVAGGDAGHEGEVGDVFVYYGPGGDKGMCADGDAANDGAVGPEGSALADEGGPELFFAGDGRAGVVDVGKDHGRSAEDVVFEGDVVVDGDVVLDFDVVADDDAVGDEDVLAQGAVGADMGAGADVGPVPDAGVGADVSAGVYDCCGVDGHMMARRMKIKREGSKAFAHGIHGKTRKKGENQKQKKQGRKIYMPAAQGQKQGQGQKKYIYACGAKPRSRAKKIYICLRRKTKVKVKGETCDEYG